MVCNDQCGCPVPCPGGSACMCVSKEGTASGQDHKQCSCGEHCGCNPCACGKNTASGTGKQHCKCGPGCACVTCAT